MRQCGHRDARLPILNPLDDDSEIGTMSIAPMTGGTFLRRDDDGITFGIQRQHFCRAKRHAQPAAFAPRSKNNDLPTGPAPRTLACLRLGHFRFSHYFQNFRQLSTS